MIKSEFKLIESIKEKLDKTQGLSNTITGIGDDCAVYKISNERYGIFSTDISIEHRHFNLKYTSLFNAGYRSMTANISDIYAMGGRPILALTTIGVPKKFTQEMISELYDGIATCAVKYKTYIAGGDTSISDSLIINISIYGEAANPIYRSGAKGEDKIYITGNTGLSMLGLKALQKNYNIKRFKKSIAKHLKPEPRGDIVNYILQKYEPTAMIDVSDGLLSDLGHICKMSKCGFELHLNKIPVDNEIQNFCDYKKINTLDYTLYSGEEFELVFTSPKEIIGDSNITYIGDIIP
ncbi:MAG: thiamine-phosphate kinase, partial [Leptospirales bacterium]|nr:thiamine-phosphate kinase [Leptospirales bacterium]